MSLRISNSRMDVYKLCPYKYYLQFVECWEADKTFSALLFGKAFDLALNYILEVNKSNKTP